LLILAGLLGAAGYLWRTHPGWLKLPGWKPRPPSVATYHPTTVHPVGKSSATVTAQLYFRRFTDSGERLVAVRRVLPGEAPAQAAVRELLSGEVPFGCERPLPPGTRLLGVRVEKGVATADFSRELQRNFQGGSDSEAVVIYAIVNTLNSLPTVERTQILVEGKALDTLGGHLEIGEPLAADEEMVIAR
jgi:spore germination protein GerM